VFLQGGGHGQFSAVPLNLLKDKEQKCDYIVTGAWSKKAVQEAQRLCAPGSVNICHSTEAEKFLRVPTDDETNKVSEGSKYVYYCTNETVNGVEFHHVPKTPEGLALVADMSSDFLSRLVPVDKFGVIWAGAQKNAGISGVTTVIIHESLLNQARPDVPVAMHYKVC
jgi:phosphoserine aminotransferase